MKKTALLVLAAIILMSCSSAFAASPWTEQKETKDKILGKLDFGIKNLLGGWTEIINRPIKYHKDGKTVSEGALVGLYNATYDTIGGALHVITFPIPIDVPLPNNGVDFN